MAPEPLLTPEDVRIWDRWQATFSMHSRTLAFQRAVDAARRVAERSLKDATSPLASWSGGKDSTAMTHLLSQMGSTTLQVVSEKDDLDYPGEEEYVLGLSKVWGTNLKVVRPPVSPMQWLMDRRGALSAG